MLSRSDTPHWKADAAILAVVACILLLTGTAGFSDAVSSYDTDPDTAPVSIDTGTTQRIYGLSTGFSKVVDLPVRAGYTVQWTYGDGTKNIQTVNSDADSVTASSPVHTFAEAGFYTITLTVFNGNWDVVWSESTIYKVGPPTVTVANGPESEIIWSDDGIVQRPADPVWEGHDFGGWFSDVDRTIPFDWNNRITEDTFVYAKWSEILFTVTFMNGGTELYSCKIYYGSRINLDEAGTPARAEGPNYSYVFNGWNTSADGTGSALTKNTVVTGDVTYYATYKVKCGSDVNNFVSIPLDQIGDTDVIEVTGASGWTVVLPCDIFDPETSSVPTLAVQKTNTNNLDKGTRVALSNKDVYTIELSVSLDGNEQPITVKLPYNKTSGSGIHSFYLDGNGRLVDNGAAETVTENGVTYAVFTTTHFSTWAIGPAEDGDYDPLESPLSTVLLLGMIVITVMVGTPPLLHYIRNRNGGR